MLNGTRGESTRSPWVEASAESRPECVENGTTRRVNRVSTCQGVNELRMAEQTRKESQESPQIP